MTTSSAAPVRTVSSYDEKRRWYCQSTASRPRATRARPTTRTSSRSRPRSVRVIGTPPGCGRSRRPVVRPWTWDWSAESTRAATAVGSPLVTTSTVMRRRLTRVASAEMTPGARSATPRARAATAGADSHRSPSAWACRWVRAAGLRASHTSTRPSRAITTPTAATPTEGVRPSRARTASSDHGEPLAQRWLTTSSRTATTATAIRTTAISAAPSAAAGRALGGVETLTGPSSAGGRRRRASRRGR